MNDDENRERLRRDGFIFEFSKPRPAPAESWKPGSRDGFTFSAGTGTAALETRFDRMIEAWVIVIVNAPDPALAALDLQRAGKVAIDAVGGDGLRHFRIESWGHDKVDAVLELWHPPGREPAPDAIETGKKAMMALANYLLSVGYGPVQP